MTLTNHVRMMTRNPLPVGMSIVIFGQRKEISMLTLGSHTCRCNVVEGGVWEIGMTSRDWTVLEFIWCIRSIFQK